MSLVKAEEVVDTVTGNQEEKSTEIVQCCDRHLLIDSRIPVSDGDNFSYIHIKDILNSGFQLQQLHGIIRERNHIVTSLERENMFLREQVKTLNTLLDQLSTSTRNLATKNDIRIKVENSSNLTMKKWYRKPKVIMSGSAIAVLFAIYLKYKIKNW